MLDPFHSRFFGQKRSAAKDGLLVLGTKRPPLFRSVRRASRFWVMRRDKVEPRRGFTGSGMTGFGRKFLGAMPKQGHRHSFACAQIVDPLTALAKTGLDGIVLSWINYRRDAVVDRQGHAVGRATSLRSCTR